MRQRNSPATNNVQHPPGQSLPVATASAVDWWSVVTALLCIFGGCILNNVFLESLVRKDKQCGDVVTLAQFIFISVQGIFSYLLSFDGTGGGVRVTKRHLPIDIYLLMVGIFFTLSFLNNLVFSFHIAMPFHMVFRSGSLVANMFLGFVAFGKR
jgi:solute carrier family 35 (UDP-xylose/UDP-N-acetylglucosamine transporter), member B4